MKKSELKQLIK